MTDLCSYCGETYELDFFEIWPRERAFMLRTCCEESEQELRDWLESYATDEEIAELLTELDFEGYTGCRVRSIVRDTADTGIAVDACLRLSAVDLDTARAFIARHHRHNPPPIGWKFGHGIWNLEQLVAVSTVGRPNARAFDAATICEITRVCSDPTLERAFTLHACSMLYGAAAREAKRRGFVRIITYTQEAELGTSLRAAGFVPVARTKGGSWNRPGRPRTDTTSTAPKVRWERLLRETGLAALWSRPRRREIA